MSNSGERNLKIAIVHNWLWNMRGAEKCLESMLEIFPDADLFALFGDSSDDSPISDLIKNRDVKYSWLNKLPKIKRIYRATFPFWAMAVESWDFSEYDLVISSSASTVKGVITPVDTKHLSYIYSPMRYIWDQESLYLSSRGWLTRKLFRLFAHWMRIWDVSSTNRIDYLLSISQFVSARIRKYYGREPDRVIYPPVNIEYLKRFKDNSISKENYYIMVSGFQENKGAMEAIQYAQSSGVELLLVGDGPMKRDLEKVASTHSNIQFTGWLTDEDLYIKLAQSKGLLFLGVEDFGLVPVEAAYLGVPVLAYGRGGALESVRRGVTGVLIDQVDVKSIEQGLAQIEGKKWDQSAMENFSKGFSSDIFKRNFIEVVKDLVDD